MQFTGRLFIADTNNSIIRYLDLNKKAPELLTLELKGVQPPNKKSRSPKRLRRRAPADAQTIKLDGISSSEGNLSVRISLPEEYHFSKVPYSCLDRQKALNILVLVISIFLTLVTFSIVIILNVHHSCFPNAGGSQ